jgi:hypothetical protein
MEIVGGTRLLKKKKIARTSNLRFSRREELSSKSSQ